jgi:hypothetical protein
MVKPAHTRNKQSGKAVRTIVAEPELEDQLFKTGKACYVHGKPLAEAHLYRARVPEISKVSENQSQLKERDVSIDSLKLTIQLAQSKYVESTSNNINSNQTSHNTNNPVTSNKIDNPSTSNKSSISITKEQKQIEIKIINPSKRDNYKQNLALGSLSAIAQKKCITHLGVALAAWNYTFSSDQRITSIIEFVEILDRHQLPLPEKSARLENSRMMFDPFYKSFYYQDQASYMANDGMLFCEILISMLNHFQFKKYFYLILNSF